MKTIIILYLLLNPFAGISQDSKTPQYFDSNIPTISYAIQDLLASSKINEKKSGNYSVVNPLPASATISITITDNGSATLADIRDNLCTIWGYTGSPSDNAAKLAFLKTWLINKITSDYVMAKQNAAALAAQSIQAQVNIQ